MHALVKTRRRSGGTHFPPGPLFSLGTISIREHINGDCVRVYSPAFARSIIRFVPTVRTQGAWTRTLSLSIGPSNLLLSDTRNRNLCRCPSDDDTWVGLEWNTYPMSFPDPSASRKPGRLTDNLHGYGS